MVADAPIDPSGRGVRPGLVAQPAEKRVGGERRKVMIPATIICPEGVTIACVIRDMSATGAKLSVSQRHRLPPEFVLSIRGSETNYPVRRAWQRSDFVGVELTLTGTDAG